MQNAVTTTTMDRLLPILRRHLRLSEATEPFPVEEKLNRMGLDSLSAINLLLDLEDGFDIVFPDALLNGETFRTALTLGDAIDQLLGR
ncbi:MAG: hypothetical protein KC418_19720 [Anaerolineales bacterium]|nr:hypothetical protein [Anaerolineales bacterium]